MNRYTYYNSDLDAFELYHLEAEELLRTSTPSKPRIQPPDEYNAVIAGLSGAVGTSISNIAVYPIDLIVKRLQVQRAIQAQTTSENNDSTKNNEKEDELYKDFVDAAKRIYKEEGGIRAFYEGCLQDTANSMGSAFIYFLSYNFMRQRRLQANTPPSGRTPKTLGVFEELSIGVLSGAIAKFFTAPIANVVTRKQTAALRRVKTEDANATKIINQIYKEKGLRGFWSGYDATLILTLNPAITFFLYETLKSLLPRKYREKPTGGQTFLLAAISKAVASSIMYPISMAKARSQVQSKEKSKGKFAVLEVLKEAFKTGGIAGMYEGVFGEILKGFFSNGMKILGSLSW
ncbi:hypothetical protein TWF730_007769 [Orbilia blumenaviensis]|uniref:Uncharacterized protein n=1 Tax=Orbilia blumenaviensis TaxID=1796055 RepID=A0AAV9V901_9PEZI